MKSNQDPNDTANLSNSERYLLTRFKFRIMHLRRISLAELLEECSSKLSELSKLYSNKIQKLLQAFDDLAIEIESKVSSNMLLDYSRNPTLVKIQDLLANSSLSNALDELLADLTSPSSLNTPDNGNNPSYYFKQNTKVLIQIDSLSLVRKEIEIEFLPECLGCEAGICQLDDNDLFYCGGKPSGKYADSLNSVYKINPVTKEWVKLPNLPFAICSIIPTQYQEFVYVFGGINTRINHSASAWRYSLLDGSWQVLRDMPHASSNVSCIFVRKHAILAGSNTHGVYHFDTAKYQKLLDTGIGMSLLFSNQHGEIFLLSKGKIYMTYEQDYTNWIIIGAYTCAINKGIVSKPHEIGNSFYFTLENGDIYKFDYNELKVEKLS